MASVLLGTEVPEVLFGVQMPNGILAAGIVYISGSKLPTLLLDPARSQNQGRRGRVRVEFVGNSPKSAKKRPDGGYLPPKIPIALIGSKPPRRPCKFHDLKILSDFSSLIDLDSFRPNTRRFLGF
jgi:hypothetical protein